MLLELILLVLGFVMLIKGADALIDGASVLAKRLGVSELFIGLTIVAFGTSLPELIVNLFANNDETAQLAIGSIVGSNSANILLVLGIAALIRPMSIYRVTVWREVLFAAMAGGVLALLIADEFIGRSEFIGLDTIDGLILLSYFALFIYYTFGKARINPEQVEAEVKAHGNVSLGKTVLLILVGAVGLGLGGNIIVESATSIASYFNVDSGFVGLTIVALGTTSPELAASLIAVRNRKSDIAVGNIVGSNLFNTFWVLGLSAFIRPLAFDTARYVDVGIAGLAGVLLFVMMAFGPGKHKIGKPTGVMFLTLYAGYLIYLGNTIAG